MNEFEYKVSVIIPVYNVEDYLEDCLNSLLEQTINKENLEVLLVDDGSKDRSLIICKRYAKMYSFIKVITKENGGVASARNLGIQCAKGKYLLFLDGDDMLTPCTIQKVTQFFDTVYKETDLVTYKIVPYRNNIAQKVHFRFNYLLKTGIYDLNKFPYISQTTMNIVVKNEKQIFFDTELSQGEDQKFITQNLLSKLKIGYCAEGEYKYIRHEGSAVSNEAYSYYLYEQRMHLWEGLFGNYEEVPVYLQSMLLANYAWEIISDCIIPYHYKGEKLNEAINRIKNLLDKVDVEMIMNHPNIDTFHKHFLVSMKTNVFPTVICEQKNLSVRIGNYELYKNKAIEIILNKIRIENGELYLCAFIKSPVFNYLEEEPVLFAVENGSRKRIELYESINSCYKTTMKTNRFFGFNYECNVKDIRNFFFEVEIEGVSYDTYFYCMPVSVFNKKIGMLDYIRENTLITLKNNVIELKEIDEQAVILHEKNRKFLGDVSEQVYKMRNRCLEYKIQKRVWLYSDSGAVEKDNAYYQFISDFEKNDGIERWYVYDNDLSKTEHLFTEEQKECLVQYGSDFHRLLYLCAEYIICSFSDIRPRMPYTNTEFIYYADLFKAITVYVQHGVLHADLRFNQSAERCKVDKIVISSYFEKENYVNNYHYREKDLIPVGMERYDYIDRNRKPKNRIVFAPSWRSYLLGRNADAKWEANLSKLMKSDYYIKFMEFLNNEDLSHLLEQNDLYLDVKFHPNMQGIVQSFEFNSERIRCVDQINMEDYKLFITDFSSFVFDFAYLNRPIVYFVPDMDQFESGMNHYRKLDLPFEKAFGNLVLNPEDAVKEIQRICDNQFRSDKVFEQRMKEFYLPLEKCAENLYNYCSNNKQ